jgi:hypothetical protein
MTGDSARKAGMTARRRKASVVAVFTKDIVESEARDRCRPRRGCLLPLAARFEE